ncbi:3686_t:CDS:2, partial [Gigaspora rosea]
RTWSVVVVSNNKQNEKKKVIVVVPLTRTIRFYPFQASVFFQGVPGKAKCEQSTAGTTPESRGYFTIPNNFQVN